MKENKTVAKFQLGPYYIRYLSYLLDLVILFGVTSLLFSYMGYKPLGFIIITNYAEGVKPLLGHQELLNFYWMIVLYLVIAFSYFYLDIITGTSVGKYISGLRTTIFPIKQNRNSSGSLLGDQTTWKKYSIQIVGAIVKSVPLLQLLNSIYVFRGKYGQTFIEKKTGNLTIVEKYSALSKRIIIVSSLIYYIPLVIGIICIGFLNTSLGLPTPSPNLNFIYNPNISQAKSIFLNNTALDIYRLTLGGFVFMTLDMIEIISSSYINALFIGGSLNTHPSFIIFGVLPHFFIETAGYVFGIVSSLYMLNALLEAINGYALAKPVSYLMNSLYKNMLIAGKYLLISVALLFIASLIETWVTSYLLYHFYYSIVLYGVLV